MLTGTDWAADVWKKGGVVTVWHLTLNRAAEHLATTTPTGGASIILPSLSISIHQPTQGDTVGEHRGWGEVGGGRGGVQNPERETHWAALALGYEGASTRTVQQRASLLDAVQQAEAALTCGAGS